MLHDSQFPPALLEQMMVERCMAENIATHQALRKRGLRMLIGGEYGLGFMPNGTNARDIGHLVDYIGLTPVEALRAATYHGGLAMGLGAGEIVAGATADLLLCEGDPTSDPKLVADAGNLRVIMKGGSFHKAPPPRPAMAVAA